MTKKANDDQPPSDLTKSAVVPLIGTAFSFLAALISGFLVYYTSNKSTAIQEKLMQVQDAQFSFEQSTKLNQFNRDAERQYVALVYKDITSKDAATQRLALSLLEVLAPDTGLKLLAWAQNSKAILPQNKEQSSELERRLETLQLNGRFRLFLHLGESKSRLVPEISAISRALASQGFAAVGIDYKGDEFGPGVDYFNDADKKGAEDIAHLMTELLPKDAPPIKARKQAGQNRSGAIGLWF